MELKPCPFCGGAAEPFYDDKDNLRWITCSQCEADGSHMGDVVLAWNTRAVLSESKPSHNEALNRPNQNTGAV
jgi:Lar family restriction alleviation protein